MVKSTPPTSHPSPRPVAGCPLLRLPGCEVCHKGGHSLLGFQVCKKTKKCESGT